MRAEPRLRRPATARSPRVSVGMPVYNGGPYLALALESILAQTFGDFELIVSDNASTDGTDAICREYAARDGRIRYVRNRENIGANRNLNRVIELSSAPYVKVANADDLCHPELIERCVGQLDAHPDAVLCYGQTTLIDETGGVIGPYDDDLDLRSPRPADRFKAVITRLSLVNVHQGVMRAAALKQTGLLRDHPGADVAMLAGLALHGRFLEWPDRLFFRRMHPGASSHLDNAAKQAYVDPARAGRGLIVTRQFRSYMAAAAAGPIPLSLKITLVVWILRLAVACRNRLRPEYELAVRQLIRRLRHGGMAPAARPRG
ncbi:MAG: glycosyltransferase [Candidatus Rokubacteria bacterium]|nr:glycosyltransferase [Candidatus Rokubacteria bacterium]